MHWFIWVASGIACVCYLLGFVTHALMASSSIQELLRENSDLKSMLNRLASEAPDPYLFFEGKNINAQRTK